MHFAAVWGIMETIIDVSEKGYSMGELSRLPNVGKVLEQQLCEVGVCSYEELERLGSREAWLRIQAIDPSACYNRLMALEGAIRLVKKTELPEELKRELKQFYTEHKL